MSNKPISIGAKKTNFRWVMCALLFVATTVNYLDRQVLSLTWKDFIAEDFHWTDSQYGTITGVFSIAYAIACLFAGKFIDWLGTKTQGCQGRKRPCFGRIDKFGGDVHILPYGSGYRRIG